MDLSPVFLSSLSPSTSAVIQFFKHWKIVVEFRRKFADSIIMHQQANFSNVIKKGVHQAPQGRIEFPSYRDPQPPYPYPVNYSLLPLLSSRPGLKQLFPSNKATNSHSCKSCSLSIWNSISHVICVFWWQEIHLRYWIILLVLFQMLDW
jgi:hypothetical protein